MADITVSYEGNEIATMSASGTKTFYTAGKYCDDDITLTYVQPSGGGSITGAVPYPVTFTNSRNSTVTFVRILYDPVVLISGYSQGISSNTSVTYSDMATDGTHVWFRSSATSMGITYNGSPATFINDNNYFRLEIPAGFDGTIPFIFT